MPAARQSVEFRACPAPELRAGGTDADPDERRSARTITRQEDERPALVMVLAPVLGLLLWLGLIALFL